MKDLLTIFMIILLGYGIGNIKIKGIGLGTSGILLVSLFMGNFGFSVSKLLGNIGLILFVGSVGFISGPVIIENLRKRATVYLTIGFLVILTGTLITVLYIYLFDIPVALALGMFSGALTSTPALSSGIEAVSDPELLVAGYGICYVFGVVGVVLFVQLAPKIFSWRPDKEDEELISTEDVVTIEDIEEEEYSGFRLDKFNLSAFSLAMILGVILGNWDIAISEQINFSLGLSGGVLLSGLFFGNIRHIGRLSLEMDEEVLVVLRELGLCLFLMSTGLSSGSGFVEIVQQYGIKLFIMGSLITLIPMLVAYILGTRVFHLDIPNVLGCISGAMTSTPALGILMDENYDEEVIGSTYAATYPLALIILVFVPQIIVMIF